MISTLGQILKRDGMSLRAFAKLVGRTAGAVCLWVNNKREPSSMEEYYKIYIASKRECTPNDFMFDRYPEERKRYEEAQKKRS